MREQDAWRSLGLALTILTVGILATDCGGKDRSDKPQPCSPTISLVTPDTGDIAGGDVVTIETACFQDDFTVDPPQVLFGSDPATLNVVDPSTLEVTTPPHPMAEAVDVEIRATGTVESALLANGFTYTSSPAACTISTITPAQGGTVGGETVTIDGSGFDTLPLPPPSVEFGAGNPSPNVTVVDDSALQVETPPGGPGTVDIYVTGQAGTCSKPGGFEYVSGSACTVLTATPNQGSTAGGETIEIVGSGFDLAPLPPPTVEFGPGNPSPSVTVVDDTRLQVVTPSRGAGTVDIIVSVQAGSCSLAGGFEYVAPGSCTVTAVTPDQGFLDEVTTVFLDGSGFDMPPLPPPTVEFGAGNFGTNVTVIRSDRLLAETPVVASAGVVDVMVTNLASQCMRPGGFEYLSRPPAPACTISSIDPDFGPDFGGNYITIYGTGFTAVSRVWLGGAEVTPVSVLGETALQITAPPGGGTVGITVDIGGGETCDLLASYRYVTCGGQPCQITAVNPGTGAAGDVVTIEGDQFEDRALVFFGDAPDLVQAVVTDYLRVPTEIDVLVPPRLGQDTTVDIRIINPSGMCCTDADAFTYTGCLIQSIFPETGTAVGGTTVTLTGEGFTAAGGPVPEVWFGAVPCTIVIPITTTQLAVQSPPAGSENLVEVRVVYPSGESCSFCCFIYYGCVVDAIVPDSGGTNGGDPLTIFGWGFDTQTIKITFDDIHAHPDFVTVDPTGTEITLLSPPSATGGPKDVKVMNETLWTECALAGGYTYLLPSGSACSVTDIDPNQGCLPGGETITIRGSGFDSDTGVLIHEMPAQLVTFVSPGEIRVVTPPYTGLRPPPPPPGQPIVIPVDVVVAPEGSDPCVVVDGFTYLQPVCGGCGISSASPDFGPVAGQNTITISGSNFCECGFEVWFGSELAQATYIDASTISVVVPPSVTGPGVVDVTYSDFTACMDTCVGCYTYN